MDPPPSQLEATCCLIKLYGATTQQKYKAAPLGAVAEQLPAVIRGVHETGQLTLSIKPGDDPSGIDTATVSLLSP